MNNTNITQLVHQLQNKLRFELFERMPTLEIGNNILELESYQSELLQTRFLRIGPLIFIEICGNIFGEDFLTPETLNYRLQETKEQFGKLYIENKKNILFVRPSIYNKSYFGRTRFLLSPHTILPIGAMLANSEHIVETGGIDLGTGDGILARVALRLGASHMTLIDWNDIQLKKAKIFLQGDGYDNFKIVWENALNKKLITILKNGSQTNDARFIITNIDHKGRIKNNFPTMENVLRKFPKIDFYIHAGFVDSSVEDDTVFLNVQKYLICNGFNVNNCKYFWNMPQDNNKTVGVTALTARKGLEK